MYHSITFRRTSDGEERNTWTDWRLIPASRPVFSPPQPTLRLVAIPGKSGTLDTTNLMGRTILYGDRSGSLEFYVENDHWPSWSEAYSTIANWLHGERLQAFLEDDSGYYYDGRFSVSQWRSDRTHSRITINYQVNPYKRAAYNYGDDWKWDPFNFETDAIQTLKYLQIPADGLTIEIEGYGYRTIPEIVCTAPATLIFDGGDPIALSVGSNYPAAAVITKGKHTLIFHGEGTVTVNYRGGSL